MRQNEPVEIIVHHSADATESPQFARINTYHKEKFNFPSRAGLYIGYHFVVERSGKVEKGREENEEGAHCRGHNISSIGICLAGNFDFQSPTAAQRNAFVVLVSQILERWQISETALYPHRAFSPTSCYGIVLGDEWARETYLQYKKKAVINTLWLILEKLQNILKLMLLRKS